MDFKNLMQTDPVCYDFVKREIERQETSIEMIPSECIASLSVIEALGSPFTNKYSEGYPYKRYYAGQEVVDEMESLAIERAKQVFGVEHVNVQPYSGSPANMAIYNAVCEVGDVTMGLSLTQGGHLTHGWSASATAKFFKPVLYWLDENGYLNMDEVERLAMEHKPKLIWAGTTAYSREVDFKRFGEIADKVGAYLAADISHIGGLVAAGVHASPVEHCHLVMTTTHKTLKGPRGAIIMVTKKGLEKDEKLAGKIDKSVFPGLQGGPHNHQTLGICVALGEAMKPEFKTMMAQVKKNAQALAAEFINYGYKLAAGGTDNHLLLMYVGAGKGVFMQEALEIAGISMNKNTVPNEPFSPFYPSGVRMGTPIMTMRGMKEAEMKQVAAWIHRVYEAVKGFDIPQDKKEQLKALEAFRAFINANEELKAIRAEVKELCLKFPIYHYQG